MNKNQGEQSHEKTPESKNSGASDAWGHGFFKQILAPVREAVARKEARKNEEKTVSASDNSLASENQFSGDLNSAKKPPHLSTFYANSHREFAWSDVALDDKKHEESWQHAPFKPESENHSPDVVFNSMYNLGLGLL